MGKDIELTDPNWLLATIAQSAAAMVAVIGGFLVSRVITLSAERRGLDRRVRETRERAEAKRSVLGEIRQDRQAISWDRFLYLAVEESAKGRGNVSDEILAEDNWVRGVPDFDEVLKMANELNRKMRVACRRIEKLATPPSSPSPSLAEQLKPLAQGVEPLLTSLGVQSQNSRLRARIEQNLEVPPGEEPIYRAALDEIVPREPSIISGFNPLSADLIGGEATAKDYQKLVDEERELTLEVLALEREERFFAGELAKVARPSGLGWGIATLAYITIVGVIVPIVALASRPVPSSLASRRILILLFISGLIALFGYLVVFGLRRRHHPKREGKSGRFGEFRKPLRPSRSPD